MMRIFMVIGLMLYTFKCSIIHDATTYSGIQISEYCPHMKYCAPGSHVMCMYYVPGRRWGPECHGTYDNVTLDANLINRILKSVNAKRSKLALGVETGRMDEALPQAKGVFRLRWDEELAMFAQVIANQCVLRHDLCRASYRFPDPGQAAARYRYTYPDWKQVQQRKTDNSTGLTMERIKRAIDNSISDWHSTKRSVTYDMILSAPDFEKNGTPIYYLEMIYGSATHMGCGISAAIEYRQYVDLKDLIYNTVNLFCNFSTRPKPGEPYFNTTPSDNRCGCPDGTYADEQCLCNENKPCEPTVRKPPPLLVLPIVSYEDAPQANLAVLERTAELRTSGNNTINKIRPFKRLESTNEKHYRKDLPEVLAWHNKTRLLLDDSVYANRNHFQKNLISRTRPLEDAEEELENLAHIADKYRIEPKTSMQQSTLFNKPQLFRLPDRSIKTIMHNHVKHRSMISDDPGQFIRDAITNQTSFSEDEKRNYYNHSNISEEKRNIYEDNKRHYSNDKLLRLIDILEHEINNYVFDVKKKKELQAKILKILENVHRSHKDFHVLHSNRDKIKSRKDSKRVHTNIKIINRRPQEFMKSKHQHQHTNLFHPYHHYLSENNYPNNKETTSNLYRAVINDEMMKNLKKSNFYINDDLYDDNLSNERKSFYQAKLNAIRKKLHVAKR